LTDNLINEPGLDSVSLVIGISEESNILVAESATYPFGSFISVSVYTSTSELSLSIKGAAPCFQKGWHLSPILSIFKAQDKKKFGKGMENRQRNSFFWNPEYR
jgi:hypothetical protein